jgi:hypothetical protein
LGLLGCQNRAVLTPAVDPAWDQGNLFGHIIDTTSKW